MRFDLTTLNLVLAIADTRSITRGAEREHLALAAASKRLSDLEARFGVVLFERRARGVEPTEAGRALVRHVRSLHAKPARAGKRGRGVLARHQGPPAHRGQCQRHQRVPAGRPGGLFQRAPAASASAWKRDQRRGAGAVAEGRADVGIFVPPLLDNRLTPLPPGRAGRPGAGPACAGAPQARALRAAAGPRHRRPAPWRRRAGADARRGRRLGRR
jgi:DNA-binding transcriptional LysR family regulator